MAWRDARGQCGCLWLRTVFSLDKLAQFGDDDPAAVKLHETFLLHFVECSGDIQAAGVDFCGEAGHEDGEFLGSGGMLAVGEKEVCYAAAVVIQGGMPYPRLRFLGFCGKNIEVVDAKNVELLEEKHHFMLGNRHEIAGRQGGESGGIALSETKKMLQLKDKRGFERLADAISTVVTPFFHRNNAVGHDDHGLTAVAFGNHIGICRTFEKVEFCMRDNLLEVVACHSHKERQLE